MVGNARSLWLRQASRRSRPRCGQLAKGLHILRSKAARLMELLDEILPTNQKVVVFVMRKAVLALLKDLVADRYNRDGRVSIDSCWRVGIVLRDMCAKVKLQQNVLPKCSYSMWHPPRLAWLTEYHENQIDRDIIEGLPGPAAGQRTKDRVIEFQDVSVAEWKEASADRNGSLDKLVLAGFGSMPLSVLASRLACSSAREEETPICVARWQMCFPLRW